MSLPILAQIERKIDLLSREERLWLIEQIAHHLRENRSKKQSIFEKQLSAMAYDPEIQTELQKIDQEFAVTEADGLEEMYMFSDSIVRP